MKSPGTSRRTSCAGPSGRRSAGWRATRSRIGSAAPLPEMTPEQRGGMLSQLLGGLAGAGGLRDVLGRIGVDPSVAANPQAASPQDVAKVAAYAKNERPDLFHKAMEFYAEHPVLVKTMGTLAVAAIAKRLAGGRRPGLL